MTNPIIKIHNAETGEISERPMNEQEYQAYLAAQTAESERQAAEAEKATAKAALLKRLGITADEAALLLS